MEYKRQVKFLLSSALNTQAVQQRFCCSSRQTPTMPTTPGCGKSPYVCDKKLCEKCGERPCKCVKKVKIELGKGKTRQIPFHCSSQTSHTIIPNYLFMNHQCYSTFSNPESPPSTTILHKDGLNPSPCREVTERRSAISGKHVGSRRRWCLKHGRDRIGHGYSLSDTLEAFSAGPERTDCELFFQQFRRQCRKPLEL